MIRFGMIVWLLTAAGAIGANQPNIVVISMGGCGTDWIGCYQDGNAESLTPNVDAMAAGGMRFSRAWSMPKSTVSRVVMLTGQYPYRNGWVNHWDVPRWGKGCHFDPEKYQTFGRILKDAGYATAITGKWVLNDFRQQSTVLEQFGFDEWCVWTGYENGNPVSDRRYWRPYVHTRDGSRLYENELSIELFTDFALDFAKNIEDKPFLLFQSMLLPSNPRTLPNGKAGGSSEARVKAMVVAADAAIGRLLKSVETCANGRETVVILTSAYAMGRPGVKRKSGEGSGKKLSNRGCGVPFIVHWPGKVAPGTVSTALVDATDITPTLVDLAGLSSSISPTWDGHSIMPVARGQAGASQRQFRLAMGGGIAVVADRRIRPALEWAPRMIGDQRFVALFESPQKPSLFFDLLAKEGSKKNVLKYPTKASAAALAAFVAEIGNHPSEDAWPAYEPLTELKQVNVSGSSKAKSGK